MGYAPTSECTKEGNDKFYNAFENAKFLCKSQEIIIRCNVRKEKHSDRLIKMDLVQRTNSCKDGFIWYTMHSKLITST